MTRALCGELARPSASRFYMLSAIAHLTAATVLFSRLTLAEYTFGPLLNQAVVKVPSLEPATFSNTFDYIIVGAGTAGLTLAHRLTKGSNASVVVLEAGHDVATDATSKFFSDIPTMDVFGCGSGDSDFVQNKIDWGIHTTPQRGCNGRVLRYARGKTAGGSSARNFMIYQRPSAQSHTSWQMLTGDKDWGYYEREQDYKRPTTFTPARQDLRNDRVPVPDTSQDYGSDDPGGACVQITYPNKAQEFSGLMMDAMDTLGVFRAASFTDGSKTHGVQFAATTINPINGHRSTSRCFYEQSMRRENFKMYFKATAKTILLTQGLQGKAKAQGVAYTTESDGRGATKIVYARNEVIISAGVFQSPQLLMVSGVGPKEQLQKYGIPPIVINENIGKNMQDHIFAGPSYRIDPKIMSLTRLAVDSGYLAKQFGLFLQRPPAGELTNNVADTIGFERIPREELDSMGLNNLSTEFADWPHVEHMSSPGLVKDFKSLFEYNAREGAFGSRFVTILMALEMPFSRGSVTLASSDMADLPKVDPGWLTDARDQKIAVWAFKRARQIFQQDPIKRYLLDEGKEYFPGFDVRTDEQILQNVRQTIMPVWHASCTCSMQRRELGGVLDNRLRVYGVDALRVVDASSFPRLLPGHPTSVVYMLAERAAVLIKEDNS